MAMGEEGVPERRRRGWLFGSESVCREKCLAPGIEGPNP